MNYTMIWSAILLSLIATTLVACLAFKSSEEDEDL